MTVAEDQYIDPQGLYKTDYKVVLGRPGMRLMIGNLTIERLVHITTHDAAIEFLREWVENPSITLVEGYDNTYQVFSRTENTF